jgi:branched-chain amino acid transport system permease protein
MEDCLRKDRIILPLFVFGCAAALLPLVITNAYSRHLLVLAIIFSMLALSLDVIIGHMGQFSFGHQAFFGLGAYTTGLLSVKAGIGVLPSFIAGILMSGIFGLIVGLIALKKARGVLLGIITLGVGKIMWLLALKWSRFTGGNQGLPGIPHISLQIPGYGKITLDSEASYYYFALFLLIVTVYLVYTWKHSRVGKAVSAVRENEELAKAVGINPYKCYVGAFTFACTLSGLSGVTYAHYMTITSPVNMSMYYMFWMLVMVIVGGMRTYAGPMLGAVIFVFLPEWLSVAAEYRMVLVGVVVLVCITFMRQGIIPSSLLLWGRLLDRFLPHRDC